MSTSLTWFDGVTYQIPASGEVNWPSLSAFLIALGQKAGIVVQMKQAIRVATTTPITVVDSTDFTVVSKLAVPGPVVFNLPAGSAGRVFTIIEGTGDGSTNNVTINRGGSDTINGATSLVLNHNRQTVMLQYDAGTTDWKVMANCSPAGTIVPADITGVFPPDKGGTGVANNAASTQTIVGNFAKTETLTGVTSVTFPTSGTLATLAGTEVLTNKTLTSPTVNSGTLATPLLTGSSDYTTTTAPSTPASGHLAFYASSVDGKLHTKDSSGTDSVVGAAGSGELNLVANPSDAVGWSKTGTTGAGANSPATTTTSTDLPLGGIVATAIKLTSGTSAGAEASNYTSYSFTTPAAYAVKTKVEFWMRPGANFIANEWTVSVYAGSTRQALSTDSSSVTYLPNALGKFTAYFDSVISTAYTVRFARTVNAGANAGVLNVANVIVGPGIQPQGAVVGPWQTYTPTITNIPTSASSAQYRRIGDSIQIIFALTASGAATGSITVSLPTGFTVNTGVTTNDFGQASASSGGNYWIGTAAYTGSASNFGVNSGNGSTSWGNSGNPFTWANGSSMRGILTVPVNELAGSATVNLAQNDLGWVSNSSTSNSNDTTSFAYGPAGSLVPTITASAGSTNVDKTVNFTSPIQVGDQFILETQRASGGIWLAVPNNDYDAYHGVGTTRYGLGVLTTSAVVGGTAAIVRFAVGGANTVAAATYGATGNSYPNTAGDLYRVRKVSSGTAVGFGQASGTSLGLVTSFAPSARSTVTTAIGNYTVLDLDGYDTFIGSSTSAQTFTLPLPSTNVGRKFYFKKSAAGGSLIVTPPSGTIDAASSITLYSRNADVQVVSDGTNFLTIGRQVEDGTYTPTVTNSSNVVSITAQVCQYSRVGNVVTVSGSIDMGTSSAGNTDSAVHITIPFGANFTSSRQAGGAGAGPGNSSSSVYEACRFYSNNGAATVDMEWAATGTAVRTFSFTFTYLLQ